MSEPNPPYTPAAKPLSAERLAEIRERLATISPAPWKRDPATGGNDCGVVYSAEEDTVLQVFGNGWCVERQEEYGEADLDFLEAAPTDMAALISELDRTRAELREVLEGLRSPFLKNPHVRKTYKIGLTDGRNLERAAANLYAALKLIENGFPVGPLPEGKEVPRG